MSFVWSFLKFPLAGFFGRSLKGFQSQVRIEDGTDQPLTSTRAGQTFTLGKGDTAEVDGAPVLTIDDKRVTFKNAGTAETTGETATIDVEGWQAEADAVPALRQEAEAAFLSDALELTSVELASVRHARQQDDEIYAALEQQLGMAPTRFYDSHDDSTRLYQVASTVVKCFGSLYGQRPVGGAKRDMVDAVLGFFGVDEQPASWHTDRLQIDNVVVNL